MISTRSTLRDRLLTSDVAQRFFAEVNRLARRFMRDEHFTVDGTRIQAWASQKSFSPEGRIRRRDGTNFRGQKRSNETHQSTTDPESRLYKKSYGKESKRAYLGHALMENRKGLIAAAMATQADGHAERDAALLLLHERQKDSSRCIPVGADKAYDAKNFLAGAPALHVTAHVQKNETSRRSNLDRRTTRHPGYALSLSCRWLIEETFGWLKQTGRLAQVNCEVWRTSTGPSSSVALPTICCACHGSSQARPSKTPSGSAPESGLRSSQPPLKQRPGHQQAAENQLPVQPMSPKPITANKPSLFQQAPSTRSGAAVSGRRKDATKINQICHRLSTFNRIKGIW